MEKKEKNKNILIGGLVAIIMILVGSLIYIELINKDNSVVGSNDITTNCINDNNLNYEKIFGNFKNYDGSYASYKTVKMVHLDGKRVAYAYLLIDGKVKFKIDGDSKNNEDYVLANVQDVYDITFDDSGMGSENLYILTKNGDVYKYTFADYESKKNTATKINELSNIVKFVDITLCKIENAGCRTSFGVIDKVGNYKEISSFDD